MFSSGFPTKPRQIKNEKNLIKRKKQAAFTSSTVEARVGSKYDAWSYNRNKTLEIHFLCTCCWAEKKETRTRKKNNDRKGDSYKEKKQREVDSHLGENSLIWPR